MIVDEYGTALQEKYYEIDSTLQLSCIVRNVVMSSSVVYWSHGDQILNYDTTRGGVSVKTELMEDGANSTLFIAKINKSDSGNYTCSINSSHEYNIMVHILNAEEVESLPTEQGWLAELRHIVSLIHLNSYGSRKNRENGFILYVRIITSLIDEME
ncbi:unnamed protein product [Hermetia illucens]|uniref:Ig-like domain-containing protein n=1 Tax=Hermetia illucens TaxID=343691 RepID=A0A7R8YQP0_HERIL|nr:unnamed protein product [Hermetia illucens]